MKRKLCVLFLLSGSFSRAENIQGVTLFNELVVFNSATPGTVSAPMAVGNLLSFEAIIAADFLVDSSELYVLTNAPGAGGPSEYRLRYVNTATGASSVIGSFFTLAGVTRLGMDFLNGTGLARLTTDSSQNFRLSTLDGSKTNDPNLAYAAGDPSSGTVPNVTAIAMAALSAGGTTYGIDNTTDKLVTLDSDNSGTIRTVGSLGIIIGQFDALCFDISTTSGTAYLSVGNNGTQTTVLYTVNLATGAATLVGNIGSSILLRGMSVGGSGGGPTPTDITWTGGSGVTSDPANWSPGQLPTSADNVYIQSGSPRVDGLLEAAHLVNDQTVTFTNGTWHIHASLTNDGSINLHDDEITFHGNLGIYGGGNLFMDGGNLLSGDPTDVLFNIGNRILGSGYIPGNFINQSNAVVTANGDGLLYLNRPAGNDGFMNALDNSILAVSDGLGSTLDNSGGTIRALNSGSVFLGGPISGGQILNQQNEPGALAGPDGFNPEQIRAPPSAGVFFGSYSFVPEPAELHDDHGFATLGGLDINGDPAEFTLLPGMDLALRGSLSVNGIVRAYGNNVQSISRIYVNSNTLLGGSGAIELGWGGRDSDEMNGGNNILTLLLGPRLSGGGKINTEIHNFGSSLIADRHSATEGTYPLRFYKPLKNLGLMRAENSGELDIQSPSLIQWEDGISVTGRVESVTGGAVAFRGTNIRGGTLRSGTGQSPFLYHFATLDGEQAPDITLQGTHRAGGEFLDRLNLFGDIVFDSGATLQVLGDSTLRAAGNTELKGFGLVHLGADGNGSDLEVNGGVVYNGVAIAGEGTLNGNGTLWIRPAGNLHAFGGTLRTYAPVTNENVMEAGGRPADGQQNVVGDLEIGSWINNGGTVRVNNDVSSLTLYGGTITGGRVVTRGGSSGKVYLYGGLEDVTLVNNIRAIGDTFCDLKGTIRFEPGIYTDSYVVAGGNSGQTTDVGIVGTVILDGLGGVWLVDPNLTSGNASLVQGDSNPATVEKLILRNDARIRGAGLVDVDVYNESGLILADTPGGNLVFAPGRLQPMTAALPAYTNDQITNNPNLVRPDFALGVIQAATGASVEFQQAFISGQQILMTGTGRAVFSGLNPVLGSLKVFLEDAAELVATNLTVGAAAMLAVVGDQLPGLAATAGCSVPDIPASTGPAIRANGIVAAGGGNIVAAGGGNIVAAGGGNIVAAGGGNIVAAGGGNIVAAGAGNIVAAGGGNISNIATGSMVAAGGLNGLAATAAVAPGQLRVENNGSLSSNNSNIRMNGGNRNTVMADNQAGGRMNLSNGSCMKVPTGQFRNSGSLQASQSNVVTGFFSNVGNAVVSGVSWAWNGAVGAATGIVNGVGGVINATGSFFGRLFGGAGLEGGGGGFALAAVGDADASDFINDGTIILGDTICTNTFDMGFTQTATGRLSVQLGGVATNNYDRLFINGPTVLGGVLQLVFTNNFAPALGDTFDFLVCPNVLSNFDSVEIAGLPAGHNWQYHSVFTNGAYRVVSDSTVALPLAAFRGLHGLAGDGSQDYANPSGDRVPNLFKYAFGLAENAGDLLNANAHRMASITDTTGLPALFKTGPGVFQFVFVRRKASALPGITYTPEISTSLAGTWADLVPDDTVVEEIPPGRERVRMILNSPFDPPYGNGAHVRVRIDRL